MQLARVGLASMLLCGMVHAKDIIVGTPPWQYVPPSCCIN